MPRADSNRERKRTKHNKTKAVILCAPRLFSRGGCLFSKGGFFYTYFDYFFSPDRERPCAPRVLRFLWLAVGAVGIISPLRSLTPRGSLTFPNNTRAPCFSYNWFLRFRFRLVCFLPSFISQGLKPFGFPFVAVSVCFPRLPAPFCRFPVFLSGAPSGWWWSPLFVSVSRWFLLCPPCFLCPVFAVPRFCRLFCALCPYKERERGAVVFHRKPLQKYC